MVYVFLFWSSLKFICSGRKKKKKHTEKEKEGGKQFPHWKINEEGEENIWRE
jgi:hypothetical protein